MRILVADDHSLIREGLRAQLATFEPRPEITEARDWRETFDAARAGDFDLALVDLQMPGREGRAALVELLHAHPGLPVVVISATAQHEVMREVLRVGAMGYLTKTEPAAVMRAAIRLVLDGGIYLPPALAELGARPSPTPGPVLTERQTQVLQLIVEGMSNPEIADRLRVSRATVKVHVAAVLEALQVDNRTQAAVVAQRLGLIPGK